MARQDSIILLRGPVGNLSFYRMNGEYFARKKSGVSGERIKSEPAYARTRENIAEFGHASMSSKLFRRAFRQLISTMADSRVTGRLTASMLRVVKSDEVNSRGQRRVGDGEAAFLTGFEFNKNCRLDERFKAQYTASIDRATGAMIIDIPAFIPMTRISAPPGATHFRLKAGGAAIDFDDDHYSLSMDESAEISISKTLHQPLKLSLSVTASSHPMFLILGIEFLQRIKNGQYNPLSAASNAMAIIDVDDSALPDLIPDIASATVKPVTSARKSLTFRKTVMLNRNPISKLELASVTNAQNVLDPLSWIGNIRAPDG